MPPPPGLALHFMEAQDISTASPIFLWRVECCVSYFLSRFFTFWNVYTSYGGKKSHFRQCYIPTTVQWDASPFCDDVWVRNDGCQRCPQSDLPRLSVQQHRRRCPVPGRCGGSFEAAWCAVSANPNSRGASTVIGWVQMTMFEDHIRSETVTLGSDVKKRRRGQWP